MMRLFTIVAQILEWAVIIMLTAALFVLLATAAAAWWNLIR